MMIHYLSALLPEIDLGYAIGSGWMLGSVVFAVVFYHASKR